MECSIKPENVSAHTALIFFFFFNDPAATEIYTLSLHDALPIYHRLAGAGPAPNDDNLFVLRARLAGRGRSEEHTSELQSRRDLVCRLLLEKKKNNITISSHAMLLHHLSAPAALPLHTIRYDYAF